ncbi:MAG: hypothetical protein ACKV22_05260 [Bryobacteraceae bacterium]
MTAQIPNDPDPGFLAGVPKGKIVRDQLELDRKSKHRPFLHPAGSIKGAKDLSSRKGFSRQ